MVKIKKKHGNIEDFNIKKIRTSLENSANDINFILTESDIQIILGDIENTLKELRNNDGHTSSYEIRGLIYNILNNMKFDKLCRSYMFPNRD